MAAASASLPVFLNTASELLKKLEAHDHQEARKMLAEARSLMAVFEDWESHPPEPHDRAQSVSALLDLQRRAMDFLARVE